MRVLVAGATGTVVLDGLDALAVGEAVAKAEPEVIIHEMTAIPASTSVRRLDESFAATNALRTRGTDYLLAAASAAGVRRFIAQSFAGYYARTGGPVKTEEDPLDPAPPAAILGAPPPRRLPGWLGKLAAGEAGLSAMTALRGASNAKARRELGWEPAWASWRDGFARGLS
jgi:nucleoside-diphosphate-sugar epimerase